MTDRDWNWNDNWDWLRSPESIDNSQTDCESSESHEQTQAKTDESTHSQTIHRRALLQTGLVALGFTGASSSGVSAATAPENGDTGKHLAVGAETDEVWSQQQKLTAADGDDTDDGFGLRVGLSDDGMTALIGALRDDDFTGSAYVFSRSEGAWSQQQKLTAADGDSNDGFGASVGLSDDGTTALIGASGNDSAYIFTESGGAWSQQQKLTASDGDGNGFFGDSVSLSGNGTTALIGAFNDDDAGAAYVFTRSNREWSQQQKLTAPDGDVSNNFGQSVGLSDDGTTALIDAFKSSAFQGSGTGPAYVFTRSNREWSQQQKLTPTDGDVTDDFGGPEDISSVGLSDDGTTALIGAFNDDDSRGSAYVFTRSNREWSQQQKLTPTDGDVDDDFGDSVGLSDDGTTALISADDDDDDTGSAYVFSRSEGAWSQQQKLTAPDGDKLDNFGFSVGLSDDGTTALIGADEDDDNTGSAYVFTENGSTPPGGGGELDLSVQAGTAPPGGTYTLTYQITNTGSTTIGDGTNSRTGVFPEINKRPPGFTTNERSIPDGGAVDGFTWFDWSIDPGETITAELQVALEQSGVGPAPGDYEFTIVAEDNAQNKEFDRASGTVTVTDPGQNRFDPKVHGFGFNNYSTPDLPGFDETIAFVEDVVLTELRQLRGLDVEVLEQLTLAGAIYTAQEGGLTNGHCLGMVFTAREYYNTGIPADELESYTPSTEQKLGVTIQTPPQTAADLVDNPENTPALNPVEVAIDNRQQTQIFDSTYVLRYLAGIAAPQTGVGSLNETEVLTAVKQQTDAGKTAPLGLLKTIESSHVVLAYDVTISVPENETAIENARSVEVSVYDPNDPLSEFPLLIFDRPTADDEFSMSEYQFGSTESDDPITAQKAIYLEEVDPDYQFFTDGAATDGFATALSEGLGSFLSVGVMSPVTVSVTRPDGRSLREVPVSAEELTQQTDTDYEEFHVGLGVSPGEYEIELTGTDTGEYTVEVTGATTDGGQINDSFTKEISAEETQTLTATVPDQDGESGTVTPPDSDPDPDTDTDIDVTRQVSSTEVSPGGEVTLTTEVSGVSGSDSVSITSSYDPALNSAPTGSVAVDDGALSPSNIDADASPTGSTLTVSNLDTTTTTDSGSVTVTVTETLSVAEEAGVTHSLTGSVTTGETTVEVDPVSVSVRSDGSTSVVDEYDTNNDGTISITELGRGGADFASGELSITELGKLGAAFASSSSSGSSSGS